MKIISMQRGLGLIPDVSHNMSKSREPLREIEKGSSQRDFEVFSCLEKMNGNKDKMMFTVLFLFVHFNHWN